MNSKLAEYVKKKFVRISQDLVDNPEGLKFKLESAKEKIAKKSVSGSFGVHVDNLKLLIRMGKAWSSKKYKGLNKQTIFYLTLAIVYFVTPTDFVPDFLLGLGFVDDIGVLTWAMKQIKPDLDKYREWENNNKEKTNTKEKENE